jgi:phosphoglycerol transferase MdoB-like AlkP superfamily enzyme
MRQIHKFILRRTAFLYIVFALILLPWTLYLAQSLPTQQVAIHWDVSWVGLDIALLSAMITTGLFSYYQSRWIVISATMLGSLLLLDAWFDILGQRGGDDLHQAVLLALFVEIPLAIASFLLAGRALVSNDTRVMPQHQKHNPRMKRQGR